MSHVVFVSQARVNHVFVSQLLCHGNCYYWKQLAFQTTEDVSPFTIINSEKDCGIGMAGIWNAMSACTICAVFFPGNLGLVHTYPAILESATFSLRLRLPSTRIRRIRHTNPHHVLFVNPLTRVEILLILSNFYPVLSPWDVRLFVFYTKTYI